MPTWTEFITALNSTSTWLKDVILIGAFLVGLVLVGMALANLREGATDPGSHGKGKEALWKLFAAATLMSLTYAWTTVSAAVWNKTSITAYQAPGGTSAELVFVGGVVALVIVVQLFGMGWFAQGIYRFSTMGTQRSQVTGGGALMQLIFAAACINSVWVVSLLQSAIGFKTTLADWLAQYGL